MKAVFALSSCAALLLLSACGGSQSAPAPEAEASWPRPLDRGDRTTWYDRPIDMRGVDPTWTGEIRQDAIRFSSVGEQPPVAFPRSTPAVTELAGEYRSTAPDGATLTLVLRSRWCNFQPGEPLQPFTVEATITRAGGASPQVLRGCAAQLGYRMRPAA